MFDTVRMFCPFYSVIPDRPDLVDQGSLKGRRLRAASCSLDCPILENSVARLYTRVRKKFASKDTVEDLKRGMLRYWLPKAVAFLEIGFKRSRLSFGHQPLHPRSTCNIWRSIQDLLRASEQVTHFHC